MKYIWLIIFTGTFIWSGIEPKDQFTWMLEIAPTIIGLIVLAATYRSFHLTPIVYTFILIHCIILMIGGHYTYAEVPGFDGLFGIERNNFDKLGHFFQGFVPTLIAREIIIRKKIIIQSRAWLNFMLLCIVLAISAFYELIEWSLALLVNEDVTAFLGTQGYQWDTQSDMAMALIGCLSSLILLSSWHRRQLNDIRGW